MTVDDQHRAIVLFQHHGNRVEHLVELRRNVGTVKVNRVVVVHVENDFVAATSHADPAAAKLAAQFGLLAVHVAADGHAAECADTGADGGALEPVTAADGTKNGAHPGTNGRPLSSAGGALLTAPGISRRGASGNKNDSGHGQSQDGSTHRNHEYSPRVFMDFRTRVNFLTHSLQRLLNSQSSSSQR